MKLVQNTEGRLVPAPAASVRKPSKYEQLVDALGMGIADVGMQAVENVKDLGRPGGVLRRVDQYFPKLVPPENGKLIDVNSPETQQLIDMALNFNPAGVGMVKAYHGSPHRFDKFSLDKIGTGEGAQAFGWGLYFTDKKAIAQHYAQPRTVPAYDGIKYRDMPQGEERSVVSSVADQIRRGQTPFVAKTQTRANIERALRAIEEGKPISSAPKNKLLKQLDIVKKIDENKVSWVDEGSNVYKATLHPNKAKEDWLDWYDEIPDKKWRKIKIQLEKEGIDSSWIKPQKLLYPPAKLKGKDLYEALQDFVKADYVGDVINRQRDVSLFLKRAGIDGIRYPTETLSGKGPKGGDAYNYVVFDEDAIKLEGVLK